MSTPAGAFGRSAAGAFIESLAGAKAAPVGIELESLYTDLVHHHHFYDGDRTVDGPNGFQSLQGVWVGDLGGGPSDFSLVPNGLTADPYWNTWLQQGNVFGALAHPLTHGPYFDTAGVLITSAARPALGYCIYPADRDTPGLWVGGVNRLHTYASYDTMTIFVPRNPTGDSAAPNDYQFSFGRFVAQREDYVVTALPYDPGDSGTWQSQNHYRDLLHDLMLTSIYGTVSKPFDNAIQIVSKLPDGYPIWPHAPFPSSVSFSLAGPSSFDAPLLPWTNPFELVTVT